MNIKYRFKRFRIKLRILAKKKMELDEIQQKAYDITIKLINDKESYLVQDTLGRKTIKNKDNYIILTKNHILIAYDTIPNKIFVEDSIMDNINEKFKTKIIKKIDAYEKLVLSKVKKDLDVIFDKI